MSDASTTARPKGRQVIITRQVAVALLAVGLSWFVMQKYVRLRDATYGWSRLILFGSEFAADSLPRLQRTVHYVDPRPAAAAGYDGQFYAQLALDPTLRDPAFDRALDLPAYRARRIGLPFFAFCLGGFEPGRVIQVYALSNLVFWFVLLGALAVLFRPWSGQQLLGWATAVLSFGVLTSMERALIDLPAAAMIFAGMAAASWLRYGAFAAALLTRETSLLAVTGAAVPSRAGQVRGWKNLLAKLGLALLPLAGWMLYVHQRFRGQPSAAGLGNFGWPGQAMVLQFIDDLKASAGHWPGRSGATVHTIGWLYADATVHQVLIMLALLGQVLFFAVRRDVHAPLWRMGVCYAVLWAMLGPAVWEDASAAARVLLPLTLCFYLLLARQPARWFWPFFLLGSLSVPFGVHDWWKR